MSSFNALARVAAFSAGRAPTSSRRFIAAVPARRFSSGEDAKLSPPPPPPEPPSKSGGSSFLHRLGAFLTGMGLGGGLGYYTLVAEIKQSTAALEKAIAKNHAAIAKNHAELSDRVGELEK
eukprot:g9184.t1